jgi:hypothetical protein
MVEEYLANSPSENSSGVPRSFSTFSAFHKNIHSESSLPPTPTDYKHHCPSDQHTALPPITMPTPQMEKEKKMHTFRKLKEIASPRLKSGALMLLAKRNNIQTQKTSPKDTESISFRKGWLKKAPSVRKNDFVTASSENIPTSYPVHESAEDDDSRNDRPAAELHNNNASKPSGAVSTSPVEPDLSYSPQQYLIKNRNDSHDSFVSCNSSSQLSESNSVKKPLGQMEMLLTVDTSRDRLHSTRR